MRSFERHMENGLVPWQVAAARSVVGEAATTAAVITHAMHGAIGISQEHELQAVARPLKRAQMSFGSSHCCATQLSVARLASAAGRSVDFLRNTVMN